MRGAVGRIAEIPRALDAIETAQPQPRAPSPLSWPRFRSPRPVSPRYFGRRAPRPVTSPSVCSLPGCCDREMNKHPCPASSLSDHAHPAGVQVPGSHPAWASRPRPLEGHPVRPPRAGQVRWGPHIGWNPELGASPGAGHEARSREATPAWGGVPADAGEPPRLRRAQLVLPGKWGPSRFGGLAAKCG